jgi:hypothetical protein
LADEVLSNKILDWLLEKANVTEGPIPAKYAPDAETSDEGAAVAETTEQAPAKKASRAKKKASEPAAEEASADEAADQAEA